MTCFQTLSGVCGRGRLRSKLATVIDDMRDSITYLRRAISLSGGLLLPLLMALCLAAACRNSSDQTKSAELRPVPVSRETPSQLILPGASATPTPAKEHLAPPQSDEVRQAIARIFEQSAMMDDSRTPAFLVGDFNGDGSQDIAVITRPTENALGEINNELANWVLEDPREIPLPGTKAAAEMRKPKPTKAERTDELLTVIHGVGSQGWRNPEARQTYLLRNAVGANATVQNANQTSESSSSPPRHGDVISETLNGQRGLICWTGAKYAWVPQR